MVVKELFLPLSKRSHVDDSIRRYSHSVQRGGMGNGRNDHQPGIFKAYETAIKEMIHGRSQQKSVFAVKPLLIV